MAISSESGIASRRGGWASILYCRLSHTAPTSTPKLVAHGLSGTFDHPLAVCPVSSTLMPSLSCLCVVKGHVEAVQLMLALAPQHVNARDNVGYTPLHWAAGKGHVAIVQVRQLLQNMSSYMVFGIRGSIRRSRVPRPRASRGGAAAHTHTSGPRRLDRWTAQQA